MEEIDEKCLSSDFTSIHGQKHIITDYSNNQKLCKEICLQSNKSNNNLSFMMKK